MMSPRAMGAHVLGSSRLRRIAFGVVIVGLIALAWYEVTKQARLQQPRIFPDSIVYLHTAAQPLAYDHLFYPKPFTVPALYRALDGDPAAIATFQLYFALFAWTLFGFLLCASLRRMRARVAAVAITFVFLLAPYRIGFASAILSESITDSLTTLVTALGFALALATRLPVGRTRTFACWSATGALFVVTAAWLFARDSNAVAAVAAIAIAVGIWRVYRVWRDARWAPALIAAIAITSAFAVWTTRTGPSAPSHLLVHEGVPVEYIPRVAFPTLNNVILRVLPDPSARAFFIAHGLPDVDLLATLTWDPPDLRFYSDPKLARARAWIGANASSVYMRWLLAHPLDRADDLARQIWDVIASENLTRYMPEGWIHVYGFPGWTVRRATTSELLLLALLIAAPFTVRRPRGHMTTAVAVVLIGSGVLAAAAAYYGDAYEVARHSFGAGQQIVLGLFLTPLAWLDQARAG